MNTLFFLLYISVTPSSRHTSTTQTIHLWPAVIAAHGLYALASLLQMLLTHPQESYREKFIQTHSQTQTRAHACAHTHIHTDSHTQSYKALTMLLSACHLIKSLKLTHTFTPSCASNTHMNQDYVRSMLCQIAYGYHL